MRNLREIESEFKETVLDKIMSNDFKIKEYKSAGVYILDIDSLDIKADFKKGIYYKNLEISSFKGKDYIKQIIIDKRPSKFNTKIVSYSSIIGKNWNLNKLIYENVN